MAELLWLQLIWLVDWWAGVKVIRSIKLRNPKSVSLHFGKAQMHPSQLFKGKKNLQQHCFVYSFGLHGPSCWLIDRNIKADTLAYCLITCMKIGSMPLNGPLENIVWQWHTE